MNDDSVGHFLAALGVSLGRHPTVIDFGGRVYEDVAFHGTLNGDGIHGSEATVHGGLTSEEILSEKSDGKTGSKQRKPEAAHKVQIHWM